MKKRISQILAFILALFLMVNISPSLAFAEGEQLTTAISSANVSLGATFDVNVSLQNNPGISAYKIMLEYDETVLTLNSVTYNTEMGGTPVSPQKLQSPVTLFWYSGLTDVDYDGVFATLSFTASDSLTQNTSTTISAFFDEDDITNTNSDSVPMTVENGIVSVILVKPGDINGDNKTNNKDLVCFAQYMANWDVTVNEAALDTTGDGKVNNKDLVRLAQYLANWDVEIFPQATEPTTCAHTLLHVDALAATCVSTGNVEHWTCSKCGKFFSDAAGSNEIAQSATVIAIDPDNHVHKEIIPAQAPTYTQTGNKEGWRCLDCGATEVEIVPMLEAESYSITYNEAGTNIYLAGQNLSAQNTNRTTYKAGDSFTLKELSVDGFTFEGWYDGQGASANRISRITADMTGDIELFAHWTELTYRIQFSSNLYPIDSITYTVSEGAVLPTPSLSNYVFAGWTNNEGQLIQNTVIPEGTTGNLMLTANWTSERNKTVTYNNLKDPWVYEDEENNMIFFAYEIGEIQNVPLQTIKDFGYISGNGITKTETSTYSRSISETEILSYASAVSNATTNSSNWTLSSGWTDSTTIDNRWITEHGYTEEEATTKGTSQTGTWNISSGKSGTYETTKLSTNQANSSNEVKLSGSKSSTQSDKISAGIKSEVGAKGFGVEAKVSANLDVEESSSSTKTRGMEVGGSQGVMNLNTSSSSSSSSWNSSSSYGGSNTSSVSNTSLHAFTEQISEETGYGQTYISEGSQNNTEGISNTASSSEEYSVETSYDITTGEEITSTWTTKDTKAGYHRWIIAGTMHVFAIVGYDMETKSFFVKTYSIMDDYTYEFEDYSYTTPLYNDNQWGVISFEVPEYVKNYIEEKTCFTEGLVINQNTDIIMEYNGTDNCVIIPDYMPVYSYTGSDGTKHYTIVKVTGISENAFRNNHNIAAVVLPEAVTSIPAGAFQNCTSLVGVVGGTVTEIGDNAFNGCTSIECVAVPSAVTALGTNAFTGAQTVLVNASSATIAKNAVESGAQNTVLYTNHLNNGPEEFSGMTMTIPDSTESIVFNGFGQEFPDLKIVSDADKTVLNQFNITSSTGLPLRLSSYDIVFNQTTISSNNLCLVSTAGSVNLGLQGTVRFNSGTQNTMLSRSVSLYKSVSNAAGTLTSSGNILVCGTVSGQNMLARNGEEIVYISEADYNQYLDGVIVITLDVNGGEGLDSCSIEAFRNKPIGTLPEPSREFYEFDGWYTDLTGGTKVNPETSFPSETTLYAHWIARTYEISFNSNGGNESFDNITAFCDQAIGELPVPTRNLYTFDGWYTAAEGGERITATTIRDTAEDLLLYAHWTANQHTVTFDANADGVTLSESSKVVTCDSAIGVLPEAARDYYRFDGWYTDSSGGMKITDTTIVTADSDFTLYAHWVEGDVYDWTLASEVPADAQIVDEKWTYTLTSTTESTASTLNGWTQTGNYWKKTATGSSYYASFPSGYDTDHKYYKNWRKSAYGPSETESKKRVVSNAFAGYVYWHWMYDCGNSSGIPNRAIYNKKGTGSGTGYYYKFFGAFTSTKADYDHDQYYCNSLGITNYIVPERTAYSQCQGATRWFRFKYYKSTYTDYEKIYQYQKVENLESSTEMSASGTISNVQHWVRYRYRDNPDNLNNLNEVLTDAMEVQEPVMISSIEETLADDIEVVAPTVEVDVVE